MGSANKKRGPTYTIEFPALESGTFPTLLWNTPHLLSQLVKATEPVVRLECGMDEIKSLSIAFRIASTANPESVGERMRAVNRQIDDVLEKHERDREEARARRLVRTGELFEFKISLQYIEPEIWRRVHVPDCTLYDLHNIIQIAMGWEDAHMHEFKVDGVRYSMPESDDFDVDSAGGDETRTLLSQIITPKRRKVKIHYEYDFGDGWGHDVVFESRPARLPRVSYPRCIDGARQCPPEDSGGPWGYERYLKALAHPAQEDSADDLEWIGRNWNPEKFSLTAVNKNLRNLEFIEDDDS